MISITILRTYNFHINLYDLAFLGTIFIGLTFAVLLLFTKSINQAAKQFLGLALMVMVLCMIHILGIDICLDTYFPRCRKPNVIKLRKAL